MIMLYEQILIVCIRLKLFYSGELLILVFFCKTYFYSVVERHNFNHVLGELHSSQPAEQNRTDETVRRGCAEAYH
jgi:hypothetical protein